MLDAQVHFTEAFARCRDCDTHFLLEAVDLKGAQTLLRVSTVDATALAKTLRALDQGSCDIHRARAEVASTAHRSQVLAQWLLMQSGEVLRWVAAPTGVSASATWREVPRPGELLEAVIA